MTMEMALGFVAGLIVGAFFCWLWVTRSIEHMFRPPD